MRVARNATKQIEKGDKDGVANINKLRGRMVEQGMNVADLASKLGMDTTTMYRRMNNPDDFTIAEINAIKHYLHLSNDLAMEIFFTNDVA